MSLPRRTALLILWLAPPAEAWLALHLGLGWELPTLAGVLLAAGASAAQHRGRGRATADLALACALLPAAALAMGWLLAAGVAGELALLPLLGAVGFTHSLKTRRAFPLAACGAVLVALLPWLAGAATHDTGWRAAGWRAVLLAAPLLVLAALRRPAAPENARRHLRMRGLRMSGLRRRDPIAPPAPAFLFQAERRGDGGLALGLALAAPPDGALRIRILPP